MLPSFSHFLAVPLSHSLSVLFVCYILAFPSHPFSLLPSRALSLARSYLSLPFFLPLHRFADCPNYCAEPGGRANVRARGELRIPWARAIRARVGEEKCGAVSQWGDPPADGMYPLKKQSPLQSLNSDWHGHLQPPLSSCFLLMLRADAVLS
jgi:hypothetical protein